MRDASPNHRILHRLFPFLAWLTDYEASFFKKDLLAGLTVAVVLVPQAMAYAILAGLPPVYGLYAAMVTPFIAALWGSLRQLATGPIAIMSLLVLTSLTPLAEPGSREFIELAFLLSFMVGVLYLVLGLFRLGEVMSFISHSAVKGFTSAAALIIIATQLPHLLGLTVTRHEYIFPMLLEILRSVPELHGLTLLIGAVAFAIIYGAKRYKPNFPAGLVALALATLTVVLLGLDEKGVAIVGKVPSGLPGFFLPPIDFSTVSSLIGPAVVIGLVSFAETYSVGKAISAQTKQRVNVNQEFVGQGLANLIGSFFQCYPVAGSFSRTAINFAAGARTGMSGVVSSLIVVCALLFLTPLLTNIPRSALAALVISAVMLLFHPEEVFALWKKNRHDGIVAISVFVLALVSKPDYALLIGIVISLMFYLWKTMHPRIIRITKDPELNMFLNADVHQKPSCPQILHLRSDNPIYFANAEYTIEHILDRLDEQTTPVKFLLFDLEVVGFIDLTGVDELSTLLDEVRQRKIETAIMGVHLPVMAVMKSSGMIEQIKPGFLIEKRAEAITFLVKLLDHDYCKNVCPYELFFECADVK